MHRLTKPKFLCASDRRRRLLLLPHTVRAAAPVAAVHAVAAADVAVAGRHEGVFIALQFWSRRAIAITVSSGARSLKRPIYIYIFYFILKICINIAS